MQRYGLRQPRGQGVLQNAEHGIDIRCIHQFIAEESCLTGPDIVERVRTIGDFGSRYGKEGKCAAGPELNSDHALLAAGVDDKAVSACSAEDRRCVAFEFVDVLAVVDADRLFAQVEYDTRFAIGQQPFAFMRALEALGVPDTVNECRERRGWSVSAIEHVEVILYPA